MSKIKLIIADDHKLFRDGITSLLSADDHFDIIASLNDGEELIAFLKTGTVPHVILLDLSMPKMDGFEVLKVLKKDFPKVKAIALSMHNDGNYIVKCVRDGAFGYLLKNTDEEELKTAINSVANGNKYFNKEISAKMISNMALEGSEPKKLSPKETEILEFISQGLTTKEIADKLFISTRTVETHRVNMMKKLDVKNSAELIKKAAKLRLI
ncbi:response regulator [Flexithrix dorotheae]|uniref:response regulator n=1 Tax=Flexithrix dorotheae TaxID=70993 RepID=UPI00037EE305|nr:response regulator transcription factor [Flexithrix dorotheae]